MNYELIKGSTYNMNARLNFIFNSFDFKAQAIHKYHYLKGLLTLNTNLDGNGNPYFTACLKAYENYDSGSNNNGMSFLDTECETILPAPEGAYELCMQYLQTKGPALYDIVCNANLNRLLSAGGKNPCRH